MKIRKRLAAAVLAVFLAVAAVPCAVMAEKKEEKLIKVTLNEVAHSIFYAPQYVALEKGYFREEGLNVDLVTGFGADKVMTALTQEKQILDLWERRLLCMLFRRELLIR